MSSRTTIALTLTLLLTALGWFSPAAAQQPDESIPSTFQVFDCPVDYAGDDYLADCSPTGPGDYQITVYDNSFSELIGATDADGFVTFSTLPGYASFSLPFRGDQIYYYSCSDGSGTFLIDGSTNEIGLVPEDGSALSCRWYITPIGQADGSDGAEGTGSVALQVFECPVAYTGNDFLADCTPGSETTDAYLAGEGGGQERFYEADLDDAATAYFRDIPANRYSLGSGTSVSNPGGSVYLACFDVSTGSERFLFDGLNTVDDPADDPWAISITIEAGGEYACRYYETPGDESAAGPAPGSDEDPADAEVGIQIFDCPESYGGEDLAADCTPTERPVGVTLNDGYRYDESTVIRDETGDEGRAGFVDLLGGQYHLAVQDLSPTTTIYWTCFNLDDGAERFDRDGFQNRVLFFLGASADYTCRIYLTANGPEPPAPGTPGTVTVEVLSCPESYDGPDWSTECTTPVDGNRVAVSGSPVGQRMYALDIYEGNAIFRNVEPGQIRPGTDIPGHATEQRSACVIGEGPVDDALVDDSSSDGTITLAEGEGATCVIYITPLSLRG